jgi:hypothetical protein
VRLAVTIPRMKVVHPRQSGQDPTFAFAKFKL